MKLLVLCLVAVLGCRAAPTGSGTSPDSCKDDQATCQDDQATCQRRKLQKACCQKRKLAEVLGQLEKVTTTLQRSNQTLHSPPDDIKNCSCVSALASFRANIQAHLHKSNTDHFKFNKSLGHYLTIGGIEACNEENNTTTCQTSPVTIQEFFSRLRTLIQSARTRLEGHCPTQS